MFVILVGAISIISGGIWGDWKHWRNYLPTIQYFIIGDLLYNLLSWNHLEWYYPTPPNLFPNHLFNNLFIMFTLYPSSMLIFLYHLPINNLFREIRYYLIWVILWLTYELIMVSRGLCVYDYGWTYGWSIFFACIMVPMLALHHRRPLIAYLFSIPIIFFFLIWFHVPVLEPNLGRQ